VHRRRPGRRRPVRNLQLRFPGAFARNIDRNNENGSARSHFPLGIDKSTKIQTTKSPVLIESEQGFDAVQI
jgi:hypothetical protein